MTPDERIAALETGQHQLSTDIHNLSARFETFSTEVRNILREGGQTPWAVIVSGIGLIVTIGVLTFAPVYQTLGSHSELIENHRTMHGHPTMVQQISDINDELLRVREKIDSKLEVQVTRQDIDRELETIYQRLDKIGKFVVDEIRANAAIRGTNGNGH